MPDVLLSATDPATFRTEHLEPWQARFDDEIGDLEECVWCSLDDLLADDGARVRDAHRAMVEDGTPDKAAAKYLADYVPGFAAASAGFVYALTGAGVLLDGTVRWRQHPHGWPVRVDISRCLVLVTAEHPWVGLDGVEVVGSDAELRRRVVAAVESTFTPYLDVLRSLAKVGRAALWAEVADGLGTPTASMPTIPGVTGSIPLLEKLVATPGAPWRKRPTLWAAESDNGPVVVAQKGGCCLAYTGIEEPAAEPDGKPGETDPDADPEHLAYAARFPHVPGELHYCSSCSLREPADVQDRQVFWSDLVCARAARLARAAD